MIEFQYFFYVLIMVWAFSILANFNRFGFLAIPVIFIDILFFAPSVIANDFPDWRFFIILTIFVTMLFAIIAIIGD